MKIMFVCTGNICRSAMAHYLLIKKLKDKGIKNIEVYSSGIYAENGDSPTDEAIDVMEDYGVDLKNHKATNINNSDIINMDIILCATIAHKRFILEKYPELENKVYTMKEYVGLNELNISDPWGYNIVVYRNCAAEIDDVLNLLIKKLEKEKLI